MNDIINSVKFPLWIVRTAFAIILASLLGWVSNLQARDFDTEKRLTTIETHYGHIQSDINELKGGQKEILQVLRR